MTKRLKVKYKIDRRLGINLWGRSKSPINKRDYGPGEHGQGRKKITLEARSPFFNLLRFSMATWSGKLVLLAAVYTVG